MRRRLGFAIALLCALAGCAGDRPLVERYADGAWQPDAFRVVALNGQRSGATLYMGALASLAALLARLSGQDDLVIGSPVAERDRADTEGVVGLFLNVVPIRIDLAGDPSFVALQESVRDAVLAAYEHREVPFEKLVDALQRERDPSRCS